MKKLVLHILLIILPIVLIGFLCSLGNAPILMKVFVSIPVGLGWVGEIVYLLILYSLFASRVAQKNAIARRKETPQRIAAISLDNMSEANITTRQKRQKPTQIIPAIKKTNRIMPSAFVQNLSNLVGMWNPFARIYHWLRRLSTKMQKNRIGC